MLLTTYKELFKLNSEKANNLIKNEQKTWQLTREDI